MSARSEFLLVKLTVAMVAWLLFAGHAAAYTLPAPEVMGQFLALVAWAGVAFTSMLLYPVYAISRFIWGRPASKPAEAPPVGDGKNE